MSYPRITPPMPPTRRSPSAIRSLSREHWAHVESLFRDEFDTFCARHPIEDDADEDELTAQIFAAARRQGLDPEKETEVSRADKCREQGKRFILTRSSLLEDYSTCFVDGTHKDFDVDQALRMAWALFFWDTLRLGLVESEDQALLEQVAAYLLYLKKGKAKSGGNCGQNYTNIDIHGSSTVVSGSFAGDISVTTTQTGTSVHISGGSRIDKLQIHSDAQQSALAKQEEQSASTFRSMFATTGTALCVMGFVATKMMLFIPMLLVVWIVVYALKFKSPP